MKYNLKNRPRNEDILYALSNESRKKIINWFEGFEKELRELLKNHEEHQKNVNYTDYISANIISSMKEISGEDT